MFTQWWEGPTLDLLTIITILWQAGRYRFPSIRLTSSCTTANSVNDSSNYWAPQMYHKNDDDTYSIAALGHAHT
jgi:hypothetical protein